MFERWIKLFGDTLAMESVQADNVLTDRAAAPELDRARGRASLVDPFGRAISYLRVSVTDRCDFRCVYCMAENMTFLPKADLLTLEELDRLMLCVHCARRAKASPHRRRAVGPPRNHDALLLAVAPLALRRASTS